MIEQWRKSSHSGGADDATCVEVAGLVSVVGIRDSKEPGGGRLSVSPEAFGVLVERIKRGVLDLP